MSVNAQITLQGWVNTAEGVVSVGPGGVGFTLPITSPTGVSALVTMTTIAQEVAVPSGTTLMIVIPPANSVNTYFYRETSTGNTVNMTGLAWYVHVWGPSAATADIWVGTPTTNDTQPTTLYFI